MAKQKPSLNTIYISGRLRDALAPISGYALTSVVAPMGYGKTTAVNWYLDQCDRKPPVRIIRISVYSDNLTIFWKSAQSAFSHAGLDLLLHYDCPGDPAGCSMLMDALCHTFSDQITTYIFIDDFHLLTDKRITAFLCTLSGRLPTCVHLIVASRNRFLSGGEILQLSGRLLEITAQQLRLRQPELAAYVHRCGAYLNEQQLSSLLHSSEGWFSAVYLNLCAWNQTGSLPDRHSTIYEMFASEMLDPLPEAQQEFLSVMGLADEFTAQMACYITENPDTVPILNALTCQNAFVTRLPDGKTHRFHHMMKECSEAAFAKLDAKKQAHYLDRYGFWYAQQGQLLHALSAYHRCENYGAMLDIVQQDAGILVSTLQPQLVLDCLSRCPEQILLNHPLALLVLMRVMFNWKQIPNMLKLKDQFLQSIAAHPELPQEERSNLLGECDLIMSFLMYNDISKMSRLHRSASQQMSRPAVTIRQQGGWTFGSPSVLMMFHRTPGCLAVEQAEMNACMPHYYQITNHHGQGAEQVMDAEAALMQGRFSDALIGLEQTYARIQGNGQESIALCCDFLSMRLSLFVDFQPRYTVETRKQALMQQYNPMWLHIFDSVCAYHDSLLQQPEQIPPLFRDHKLDTVHFLAPGKPMMDMIENQVYLSQGEYARVVGRSEGLLAACSGLHYALVALHIRLQTASAYMQLGKQAEAQALFLDAAAAAQKDNLFIPFAENYRYLTDCWSIPASAPLAGFLSRAEALGQMFQKRTRQRSMPYHASPLLSELTPRELEIIELAAQHLTNREIAEKLFLTEGTVKQYINQIYGKLQITGETRTKRKQLFGLLSSKN